ncbi:MAG: iron-sulfur cluster assembly scaffold protein [Actinomycetota bacterium]|nr:iron-sulfur cluster assembly scaffold protein [Actinomycetota bacterium]
MEANRDAPDRKEERGAALLVEHARNPRHKNEEGAPEDADVAIPGGSPECGGSVVVYLKGDGDGKVEWLSWTGEGDTISMGATSIVVERILSGGLGMEEVLAIDYEEFIDSLGREVIGNRTRHATLGLSTIKAAIRLYQRANRSGSGAAG